MYAKRFGTFFNSHAYTAKFDNLSGDLGQGVMKNLFDIGAGNGGAPSRPKSGWREPSRYEVLIVDDRKTCGRFAVEMLQKHFGKSALDATLIMLEAHTEGAARVDTYPKDVADTKIMNVNEQSARTPSPFYPGEMMKLIFVARPVQ